MVPNTVFKNIIAKTQTTDFFIACKESRIENNTSFYGCFYLGPFDESLSQTLANDIRRTLLSEITGLAISSIEIEGILHKFSSLPGMKETALDLICNLQNIVLKKQEICSTNRTLRSTKKTYKGFLNVSGPRVIKAMDLKLPSGLHSVDPNQYIATLAEDGLLNMKFNINEGKNFIKQKPQNLDVSVLKKRNILVHKFKKKIFFSSVGKHNDNNRIKTNQGTTKQLRPKSNIPLSFQVKTSISNPIPLDAVFMPVTKINCIIEENNIYSDFSTDTVITYNQTFDNKIQLRSKSNFLTSKVIYKNQTETAQVKSSLAFGANTVSKATSFLNAMDYNSIYQTYLVLQKTNTINISTNNSTEQGQSAIADFVTNVISRKALETQNKKHREHPKSEQKSNKQTINKLQAKQKENNFKLIPWHTDSLYFDYSDISKALGHKLKQKPTTPDVQYYKNDYRLWLSIKQGWFPIGNTTRHYPCFNVVPIQQASFSKIKTFLACKASKSSQSKTNQNQIAEKQPNISHKKITTNKTKKKHKILFCKTISNIFKNTYKNVNTNNNPINQQTMYLEYAKNLKLKPLRKKSQLILEIWTNGSIHPRQALYQCFIFLSNNFLKLQTVKMLGSMFNTELAYEKIKYSIRNNYNFYKADPIKKINNDKKNRRLHRETRVFSSKSFMFGKIKLLLDQPSNTSTRKISLNQMKFYTQAALKAPIGILKISLRAYTALRKAGLLTINDLVKRSKTDLLKINNLGKKSLIHIETGLAFLGLTFKK